MDTGTPREEPSTSNVILCTLCPKMFSCLKLLNRHRNRMHKIVAVSGLRECRIICPMCEEKNDIKTHQLLRKHLEEKHAISIELLTLQFSSMHEYESWKQEEKIETCYSVQRTSKGNDHKEINYICNRSDSKGYQAKYNKRTQKSGGTIKIQGMCPSQLICRLYQDGAISVRFWKTHAGHTKELRSLHLSTSEKNIIIDKLKSGVSIDRILEDARKTEAPELQRLKLVNRDNIAYMTRKHNIYKKRDPNEMVAAVLKVQERNANSVQFLQDECTQQISEELKEQNTLENTREVRWANFKNWAESLNDDIFDKFMGNIQGAIREADQTTQKVTNKRKMKTQEYFPTNKCRKE